MQCSSEYSVICIDYLDNLLIDSQILCVCHPELVSGSIDINILYNDPHNQMLK